ncbi:MAG TPA: flagellar motor protein MotA, partial [Magnetovibrio sp.]
MADSTIQITKAKSATDVATLIGLIGGFALVIAAIVFGGSPGSFINIPSILIVIGGTLCVTMMCFSLGEMARTVKVIMKTISYTSRDSSEAAIQVLQIAELARRQGVLSLQGVLSQLESEPLLFKGMAMVVDG